MLYRSLVVSIVLLLALIAAPARAAGVHEEAVTVTVSSGVLSGTLMLPAGSGPFPVALIIAGSGPTDRDGNSGAMLRSDAYKKLAQGLASQGIATLRYDKRGIGDSIDHQPEDDLRFDDYVNDALALTGWLERDPRLHGIAIIGHSEGSLIGMLAAQQDPHVQAFVSLEGPGRDLGTIVDEQLRAAGAAPNIVNEVVSIDASLRAGKTVPDPDPQLAALFRPSVQPYLISEYRYDPAKEIAKLTIPVLIVHGSTDIQVSATDAKLLAAADPKARVANIDGMNHVLVDAPEGRAANIATYAKPGLPLSATLVPAIAQFLLSAI
jgi:alpha-beta hydrolase superfamily lysophospholipase